MAIIYSYSQGSSALQDDRVVVTRIDEEENEITTKQLTVGQIADYTATTNDIVTGTGTDNTLSMFGPGSTVIDSIVTQTTEGSINVGIVPSKGGGLPDDPYWIDKFQVQGTMSVSGNVSIGTPRQLENQGFDLNILGEEGKIAFGDNNIFGDPEIPTPITWNVVVGEYGTGDTDVLQLHGKVGTKFTRGSLGETVSMSIDNKGYVGIGTDSPSSKLHVSGGDILLDTGQNIDFNYGGKVIGNYYLNFEANLASINVGDSGSVLTFKTSSSTAVTIDNEQNVGIGTTSPDAKLHVSGGDIKLDEDKKIIFDSSGFVTAEDYLSIATTTSPSSSASVDLIGAPGAIRFTTGNSTAAYIDSSQKFGIGTTIPYAKLHVDDGNVLITNTSNASLNIERNDGAIVQIKSQPAFGYIGTTNDTSFQIRQGGSSVARFNNDGTNEIIGDTTVNGDVTADNLSGTNTGDQVLTGYLKIDGNVPLSETLTNIVDGNNTNAGVQLNNKGNLKSKTLQSKLLTVEDYSSPSQANQWLTNLTINPITNYSQIDSNKSIRFSVDGENKLTIGESGVININAIGISSATANLVCPGSFKVGNSMSSDPADQTGLTEADAGTMTYWEGADRSILFMVMKTGTNPDVYEQVVIKDIPYN